jgi:hypothetical protein
MGTVWRFFEENVRGRAVAGEQKEMGTGGQEAEKSWKFTLNRKKGEDEGEG